MSLDDFKKDSTAPASKLRKINEKIEEKKKKKQVEEHKEAEEIASEMIDGVLLDLK